MKLADLRSLILFSTLVCACNPDDSMMIGSNGEILDPITSPISGFIDQSLAEPGLGAAMGNDNVTDLEVIDIHVSQWPSSYYRCTESAISWADVDDWHYQLQDVDYEQLAMSQYDLLVIDSEPPDSRPNRNVIDRLKCAGDGEKLVLSYLSVGQAEEYRYYYQDTWEVGNPGWIASADVVWQGDYFVRYWDPEWRQLLMGSVESRVDRLIEAGFDGIYLDRVDAYQFFEDENPNAIDEMQALVVDIANYARAKSNNPDFGVFVQNAEELIEIVGPEWIEPLTGIGKEEPFYWSLDERVDDDSRYWNDLYLGMWRDAGKVVLSVDYASTFENRQDALADARAAGYIPLVISHNHLDRMDRFLDHLPD